MVTLLIVAALVGIAVWWPRGDPAIDREVLGYGDRVDATVTSAEIGPCSYDPAAECNNVSARIASGPDEGTFATLEADVATRAPVAELEVGDDIVLNDAGPDVDAAARYSFADVQRRPPLVILAVVFAVAVVALGRLRGCWRWPASASRWACCWPTCSRRCCGAPRRSAWPSPVPS